MKYHSGLVPKCVQRACGIAVAFALVSTSIGQVEFTLLTPQDGVNTVVSGMTPDGTVVIGSRGSTQQSEAFRWSAQAGIQMLGHLPGVAFSYAQGVSADGSVVAGTAAVGAVERAWVWTAETGMEELPRLPEFQRWSAKRVSEDGRVILGAVSGPSVTSVMVLWVRSGAQAGAGDGGSWEIEFPQGFEDAVFPVAMSADATRFAMNWPGSGWHWQVGDGWTQLPIPSDCLTSDAVNLSGDGSVIIGRAHDLCTPGSAFRWRRQANGCSGELQMLGALVPGKTTTPLAANRDGYVIVGAGEMFDNPLSIQAFVWTPRHGIRPLRPLIQEHGINLVGMSLKSANAVSENGSAVAGTLQMGTVRYGWVVTGLQLGCRADFDQSGVVDAADILTFLEDWFAGSMMSDFDRSAAVDVADVFAFIVEWFGGCN